MKDISISLRKLATGGPLPRNRGTRAITGAWYDRGIVGGIDRNELFGFSVLCIKD